MTSLIDQLKTFGILWRHMTSVVVVLTSLYFGARPFVEAWAGDAFVEMLKEQGVDPETFAEIQKQSKANGTAIGELSNDADKIRGDINAVKQQIGRVSDQIDHQNKSLDKVESTLQQLILLNQRRTGNEP